MKFHKQKDGEWVRPKMRGYKMGCCDCGLVHRLDFKIINNEIAFRAFRMPRTTKKLRDQNEI
jgi:Zn-finger protein